MNKQTQLHTDSCSAGQISDHLSVSITKKCARRKKHKARSHVSRRHKDSLFRLVFNNKEDLLDLYNALNGSSHTSTDDLTIFTLEDALYISYKNDISFLFGEELNLYEHQSTINPNMPVRGLIYLSRNIEAYIELMNLDIYSGVLQQLPFPQYIVFYNGTDSTPERMTLKLSDAFPAIKGKTPCLECTATLLNINYGHNRALMERCHKLEEYALFIHYIRQNQASGMTLEQAVSKAVDDCIRQHILESVLTKQRAEVKNVVLSTFNKENHERILKEHYQKIGEEHGEKRGRELLLKSMIAKKLARGKSAGQICDELELNEATVHRIINKYKL